MRGEPGFTHFSPEFVAKYGFGGWDDPRPTSKCLHCKGTGRCDEDNDCGFCYPDEEIEESSS